MLTFSIIHDDNCKQMPCRPMSDYRTQKYLLDRILYCTVFKTDMLIHKSNAVFYSHIVFGCNNCFSCKTEYTGKYISKLLTLIHAKLLNSVVTDNANISFLIHKLKMYKLPLFFLCYCSCHFLVYSFSNLFSSTPVEKPKTKKGLPSASVKYNAPGAGIKAVGDPNKKNRDKYNLGEKAKAYDFLQDDL